MSPALGVSRTTGTSMLIGSDQGGVIWKVVAVHIDVRDTEAVLRERGRRKHRRERDKNRADDSPVRNPNVHGNSARS